ncbi:helix-turn-helix domain-containing protein [Methylocystis sp. S23]
MEDVRKIVGKNVRLARQAIGLSQEALADKAEIDRTYVSGVERGVRNPTVTIVAKFAAALDTTPALLLTPDAEFPPRS